MNASPTMTSYERTATSSVGKRSKVCERRSPSEETAARCPWTDGPFAETKEQLGGFGVIEAIDLNHAIQLMSKHPSLKSGVVEIRAADDLTGMVRESERRRAATIAEL